MNHMAIFEDDAFSLESMTAAINNIDYVPGRAGELAFAGVAEGINTTTATIESTDEGLTLIQTSERGSPAPQEKRNKRTLRAFTIPQIKLEETIQAASLQGVRAFGSTDQLEGVQLVVGQQIQKMSRRHDLTLEYHRLGALKGQILDADGSELLNLYTAFGGVAPDPVVFDMDGGSDSDTIRRQCQIVRRKMLRAAKTVLPANAAIWCFAGDTFFDLLIDGVKDVFDGYAAAERRLGDNYAFDVFFFGGIFFENYRGTDDKSATVGIGQNEARFFFTNAPGLYAEYNAPADFMDTVNTVGLPRYARQAVDPEFNRWVKIHTQANPLPLCLRPQTLLSGVVAVGQSESESEL